MIKGPSFVTAWGFLTCPLALRPRVPDICGFVSCFSFSHFLGTSSLFWKLKLSSLNIELNFLQNESNFSRLNVIVCFCQVNQYSDTGCVLEKVLKNMACSKGNETKVNLRNIFINNLFALEIQKEWKNYTTIFFRDCPRILDLSLNH